MFPVKSIFYFFWDHLRVVSEMLKFINEAILRYHLSSVFVTNIEELIGQKIILSVIWCHFGNIQVEQKLVELKTVDISFLTSTICHIVFLQLHFGMWQVLAVLQNKMLSLKL